MRPALRASALVLAALLLSGTPAAIGEEPVEQVVTGELVAGALVSPTATSVYWVALAPLDGVDAHWFDLARPTEGGESVILAWRSTADVPTSMRVRFFENGWDPIFEVECWGDTWPNAPSGEIACAAPPGADAVTVEIQVGAQVRYEFRYRHG